MQARVSKSQQSELFHIVQSTKSETRHASAWRCKIIFSCYYPGDTASLKPHTHVASVFSYAKPIPFILDSVSSRNLLEEASLLQIPV